MRYFFIALFLNLVTNIFSQNLKSPEEFLGYEIGTKFTRHHAIVEYFKHVAATASANVKLEKYGKTNEGRDLYLAFVSSSENIGNLQNIAAANMSRAKLNNSSAKSDVGIVWLSYNVHGNEPSSSEAAMLTLYNLVTQQKNGWLKNTLVIIDPCLNPDGRDRYVNWYNNMVGDYPNTNAISREHEEPWPGGRVNHYHFDLNRDWAWQTQVETQQRIKVYNQWLPHVHVDFHEQGFNEPYYFAPAAEPIHEVVTPWQRDFQVTIGKNHAKYFDTNGWYYFTKERFDLFYPSYGDTYPMYNGSIGMTYEQGGHSRGGLTVQMDNGDTLTLVQRALHHHTTGMSTVEVASMYNKKMLEEFSSYYANSSNSIGSTYKTYVLTTNNKSNLQTLKNILQRNDISYTTINKVNGIGFNYANQKSETITLQSYSIAISAYQPKSLLAKVLLEPKSKLSDSVTYDITAWSLPYAFGIQAYASTTKLDIVDIYQNAPIVEPLALKPTNYAYFIPYNSLQEAQLLAELSMAKVKVYINEKEITHKARIFAKGTLMLPKKDNGPKWATAENILRKYLYDVEIVNIESGFADKGSDMGSPDNKFIAAPRIACIAGKDANPNALGEIWHFFDKEIKYPITLINSDNIRLRTLKNIDVLILPDGRNSFLSNKSVADDVKAWIQMGGRIVAIEGGANQVANTDWGLKTKKIETPENKSEYADVKTYENRERDGISDYIPGAIFEVELDNSHPLAFGYDKKYYTLKQNTDLISFNKDSWNVGVIKKNKLVSGFAGAKVLSQLKDGTVISVQEIGSGAVIYFMDDPIFRNFWHGGKLLLFNAAFLVGNNAVRL